MRADENPALTPPDAMETIEVPARRAAAMPWKGLFKPRLAWLLDWGTKGSLALTDQALFAGAQFSLNIALARWLIPDEYGAFAVAYSVFLLIGAIHIALLIEPMIVFGSGRYLESRRSYLRIVLWGHWLLTAPAGVLLLGVGILVERSQSQPVGRALCALGVALPFLLLAWLVRRAFYIELRPGRAAAGGAVYFCTLLALAGWLRAEDMLTPPTAILAMGAAALLTSGLQLMWLRSLWSQAEGKISARSLASEHWDYGRWVLASAFPSWALLNLYYLVLPAWFGLKGAGALKAMMNLAMPAIQSLIAFSVLLIPLLVRQLSGGGLALMRQTVRHVTGVFVAGATVYFVLLWLFRIPLIKLCYGGKYLEYSGFSVLLVGLVPVATACGVSFGIALRAFERPDRIFWAYLAASALSASLGLWFVSAWGVAGAAAGYLASSGAFAGTLWFFYRRLPSPEACW
jgi:O-antigen/teichoic acid export membrane protein